MTRVLIVDDHRSFADALELVLRSTNPTLVDVISVLDEAEALLHREELRADSG